jgi:RNA polymerase sigma-70 factor (ECF subfamily)
MVDRSAWLTELYEAHSQAVFSYCRRFLANAEDAADASHEVFIKAISALEADPKSPQARSWLLTVAQRHCVDLARRRQRLQKALSTLAYAPDDRPESEAEVVNRQLLQSVMAQLGERERLALWQSAVEQRPIAEIAGSLGVSYAAAGQLVHRARKHASAVVGKLGAAIGLLGLRLWRRRTAGSSVGQLIAALAIVPLVASVVLATAAATHWQLPVFSAQHSTAKHPAHASPSAAPSGAPAASGGGADGQAIDDDFFRHPVRHTLHAVGSLTKKLTGTVKGVVPQPSLPAPTPALPSSSPIAPLPTPSLPALPTPPPLPKSTA